MDISPKLEANFGNLRDLLIAELGMKDPPGCVFTANGGDKTVRFFFNCVRFQLFQKRTPTPLPLALGARLIERSFYEKNRPTTKRRIFRKDNNLSIILSNEKKRQVVL